MRASSTPASRGTCGAPSTFREGEKIDEAALKALIRAAVALNLEGKGKAVPKRRQTRKAKSKPKAAR